MNDLNSLQKEFYKAYNPDYWLYKISLLKNCRDNFDAIKNVLKIDLGNVLDNDYKRTLRTEMHFLYFQMVETLFEIIFAVSKKDNRDLWLALISPVAIDRGLFLTGRLRELDTPQINEYY